MNEAKTLSHSSNPRWGATALRVDSIEYVAIPDR